MKKTLIIFALSLALPSIGYGLDCPSVKALETVLNSKIEGAVEDFFEKKDVVINNTRHRSPVLVGNMFYKFPRGTTLIQDSLGPNHVACAYGVKEREGIFMHFEIEKVENWMKRNNM